MLGSRVIFLLALFLSLTLAQGNQSQYKTRYEMKGFLVTPRNEAEAQKLRNLRDSDFASNRRDEIPVYFQAGRIQVHRPIEVMVPLGRLASFTTKMRGAGLKPRVQTPRIKVKFYGRPLRDDQPCGEDGDDCSTRICCNGWECVETPSDSTCRRPDTL